MSEKTIEEIRQYREGAVTACLHDIHPHQLRLNAYTIDDRDDRLVIERAMERLSSTERTIIRALYLRGYSQPELARGLGYSQRHISRLHRLALKKMQPALVRKTA